MGCWCSRHSEASKTKLPPPTFGAPTKVRMKKGWLSADFEIKDVSAEKDEAKAPKWMLMDAVGGIFDSSFDYFLKYRGSSQEKSTVMGCANLQKDHDYMFFKITYSHQHRGRHRQTYRKRSRRWEDCMVEGTWVIARRARLYSDLEQENLTGRLEVVGSGTFSRQRREEHWYEKYTRRVDGKTTTEWKPKSRTSGYSRCILKQFAHKLHAYGSDFNIGYDEEKSGSWFTADSHTFVASNAKTGVPLFRATSDGENAATVETCVNGDPVSSMLAAFAVAIRLDPKEFHSVCKDYCKNNMSLWANPGSCGGFGLTDKEYKEKYLCSVIASPVVGFAFGVPVAEPVPAEEGAAVDTTKEPLLEAKGDDGAEPLFVAIPVPKIEQPKIKSEYANFQANADANAANGKDGGEDDEDGEGEGDDDGEDEKGHIDAATAGPGDEAEKAYFTEKE